MNYNQNFIYNNAWQNPYNPVQAYYSAPVQYPVQYQMQPQNYLVQAPAAYIVPSYGTTQGYYSPYKMTSPITQDTFTPQNQTQSSAKIPTAKTNKAKLSLFFINDMHGHIDNMTNILGASKQFDKDVAVKGADAIKISAGDNYAGGDVKKNNAMMKVLDYLGIEASAVGNHEYDAGTTEFYNTKANAKTQFLAANAKLPAGSKFYDNVQKSTIIEKNGNKYGVVGLMPLDLETVASKKDILEGIKPENLENSVKAVQAEVDKLRTQGVNKIILVSHIGIDKDMEIAPLLDGVDIIQGGHSHNLTPGLEQGKNVVMSKSGEPVIIVQAGENGKYAGVLDVDFDENGIITTASLDINKASLEKSPVLEQIITTELGDSPKVGVLQYVDPFPENKRIFPCAWTNLLCDSMRAELNTDIALVNAGNLRVVPKAGVLTERNITATSPQKNKLMISTMTEKEIVRVIKEAAKKSLGHATGEPGIMQVSGLSYKVTYDGNLLELNFIDKNGNKTPIDINNPSDTKTYTVAHDSFVCEERENAEYPAMFISAHKNQTVQHFDFDKDKTATDYIRKMPNKDELSVTDDGRVQIIEKDGSVRKAHGAI